MVEIAVAETIDAAPPKPVSALIFYATKHRRGQGEAQRGLVATRHTVTEDANGGALIGPGVVLGPKGMATLRRTLAGHCEPRRSRSSGPSLLPANLLALDESWMVWMAPARRGLMHFAMGEAKRSIEVPWPTLLFAASRNGALWVAALRSPRWPADKTRLFHAPLMNVDRFGSVCLGSATPPRGWGVETMPGWEATLRDTWFTHVNHQGTLAGQEGSVDSAGHFDFWQRLGASGAEAFPREALAPMKRKLGAWLEAMGGRGR